MKVPEELSMNPTDPEIGNAPELSPALQELATPTPGVLPAAPPTAAAPTAPVAAEPVAEPTTPEPSMADTDPVGHVMDQIKNLPIGQVDALLEMMAEETGQPIEPRPLAASVDDDDTIAVGRSSVSEPAVPRPPVAYGDVDPGMQRAISAVHNHMMEESVNAAIDSDEEMAYNMKDLGASARASMVSFVKDAMEKQITSEGTGFDYNWGRVAKVAFAQAKPRLQPFLDKPTPRAGMGPGGGSNQYAQRDAKPPERIPAYADTEDYASYVAAKMQYYEAQAERAAQDQIPGL